MHQNMCKSENQADKGLEFWRADLLSEQRHLSGIFRNAAAMTPGCADYRKHGERF
jgi:hypothetical protein